MIEVLTDRTKKAIAEVSERVVFVIDVTGLYSLVPKSDIKNFLIPQVAEALALKECGIFSTSSLNLIGRARPFDTNTTPAYKRGALNNWILKNMDFLRTPHPFQSIGIIGKNKEMITIDYASDSHWDYSEKSVLQYIRRMGFDVIIIGCPLNSSCFFVHQAEFNMNAPYRFMKSFDTLDNRGRKTISNVYVIKDEYLNYTGTKNVRLFANMESSNRLQFFDIADAISMYRYSYDEFFNCAEAGLKDNKFFLWDDW